MEGGRVFNIAKHEKKYFHDLKKCFQLVFECFELEDNIEEQIVEYQVLTEE